MLNNNSDVKFIRESGSSTEIVYDQTHQNVSNDTKTDLELVSAGSAKHRSKSFVDFTQKHKDTSTKNKLPKIVGDIRHYPPANKEWKNSIYAFNKNSLKSLPALDKMASKTIKSYFNLTNNKKLARSERMRNLIRRKTVKRIFVSKPEIKQTSDKVNITVYTFNREKQFFLRKIYFYDRNMYINKNIYLYKLWLKKNLLAFKNTFKDRKSIRLLKRNKKLKTLRKNKNKTYIHNILLKKYLLNAKQENNSILSKSKRLHSSSLTISPLIKKNLFKSLKRRNLIRSLKKRENKKITSAISLDTMVNSVQSKLALKKSLVVSSTKQEVKNSFKNYLVKKMSRKINFKLRSHNSIVKIQQKRSKTKRFRFSKIRLPYSNLKFKNEIKFFSFKLVSELKYIRKLFQFYFIKYILYLLHINVILAKSTRTSSLTANINNAKSFFTLTDQTNDANSNKKLNIIQFNNKYSHDKLKNIELLNLELLHLLKTILLSSNKKNSLYAIGFNNNEKENIDLLYKKFENKYFLRFLSKFFKKEFLYINYYSKFLINQLKFGKFLPGLKLLISKIYSKKVELNIVNLKYPHLNSDIYTESIATKLKRKIGLLRVLKWSLNLARLPYKYLPYNNTANLNKLQSLNIHKSLDVNLLSATGQADHSSEDKLDGLLNKLYPYSLVHGYNPLGGQTNGREIKDKYNSNLNLSLVQAQKKDKLAEKPSFIKNLSVLNTIKYKWVSGVRLEAAGRLTRRYTAARSVFKYRYKGSLKNIDYSQKTDISKKNISTVMLRNNVKSNSQYSFAKSKRRIGAFGLKAWIAGY